MNYDLRSITTIRQALYVTIKFDLNTTAIKLPTNSQVDSASFPTIPTIHSNRCDLEREREIRGDITHFQWLILLHCSFQVKHVTGAFRVHTVNCRGHVSLYLNGRGAWRWRCTAKKIPQPHYQLACTFIYRVLVLL